MAELLTELRIAGHIAAAHVRGHMQYRVSFALELLGNLLTTGMEFLAVLVIFTVTPRLQGWSLPEVAVFYGLASTTLAMANVVAGGFDEVNRLVREGRFDLMVVRPLSALLQAAATDFSVRRLGRLAQAVAVLVFGLVQAHITWSVARAAVLASGLISGTVIFLALMVMGAALSFWMVEAREITNVVTYGGAYFGSYPLDLFATWLRRSLGYAVPLAFVSWFPGIFLLGRDPLGNPAVLQLCSPLAAATLLVVARTVWNTGMRHYRSTGS